MLFLSPSLSKIIKDNETIIYNWLNGEYVILENNYILIDIFNGKNINIDSLNNKEKKNLNWLVNNKFLFIEKNEIFNIYKKKRNFSCNSNNKQIVILPAGTTCNFRCQYCYQNHEDSFMNEKDKDNIIKYIINSSDLKELTIDFFGGEPMLNLSWIIDFSKKALDYCYKKNIIYNSTITTNGYLLNKENFNLMVNICNIRTFQITLDGLEKSHDKLRPHINNKPTFKIIFNNILNMLKTHYSFNLIIHYNYNDESDFDSFISLLKDYNIQKDPRVLFLFKPIISGWNEFENNVACSKDFRGNKFKMYDTLIENKLNLLDFSMYSDFGNLFCPSGKENYIIVTPNSIIKKCTVALDDPLNNVGKLKNGILIKNENWFKWIENTIFPKTDCYNCNMYSLCNGASCPLHRIKYNESKCIAEKYYDKEIVENIVKYIEQSQE